MKRIYRTPVALILLAALTSCDRKDLEIDACETDQSKVVTQELNISSFDRIRISGDFDVQILQSESQKVYITLEPNLIDKLNKSVINKEWKLEFVDCDNRKKHIPVIINMPELKGLDLNGSSTLKTLKEFKTEDLLVSTHGTSNITMDITGKTITTIADGRSDITLSGTANKVIANLIGSGTGYQHLKSLIAPEAVINVKGSGESEIFAKDKLDVTIDGSGKVFYYGNPAVTSSISGGGNVEQGR